MNFFVDFGRASVILEFMIIDIKDRMDSWKNLPEPRPTWETWKRILSSKGFDHEKAKEQWEKIAKKKQKNLDKQG